MTPMTMLELLQKSNILESRRSAQELPSRHHRLLALPIARKSLITSLRSVKENAPKPNPHRKAPSRHPKAPGRHRPIRALALSGLADSEVSMMKVSPESLHKERRGVPPRRVDSPCYKTSVRHMKRITILFLSFALATQTAIACAAITQKGTQCKRAPSPGSQYCWQHGGTTAAQRAAGKTEADLARTRCTAITKKGTRCTRQSQPGRTRCWQH